MKKQSLLQSTPWYGYKNRVKSGVKATSSPGLFPHPFFKGKALGTRLELKCTGSALVSIPRGRITHCMFNYVFCAVLFRFA